MKLYDRQGTPNAARIRIVLAEKGLDDQVELIPVDLRAAEQKTPAFLEMNPIGKTPVLVLDDGLVISECTAITEYLDNLDGDPVFTGKTPREKAIVHMMQRRVEMMLLETDRRLFPLRDCGTWRGVAAVASARLGRRERMGRAARRAGGGEFSLSMRC